VLASDIANDDLDYEEPTVADMPVSAYEGPVSPPAHHGRGYWTGHLPHRQPPRRS
jgi:hypothetical protein